METPNMSVVQFSPSDAALNALREQCMPLVVKGLDDKEGFDAVHGARMTVKRYRVDIEKTRVRLKADALEYGRKIDTEAKRLTAIIEPIEEHLTREEEKVTKEKARLAKLKLDERMTRLAAIEAVLPPSAVETLSDAEFERQFQACATAYADRKAREKAEADRLAKEAEERKAEGARLAAERSALEQAQAEHRAAEAKLAQQRADIESEKARQVRERELAEAREQAAAKGKAQAEADARRREQEKADAELRRKEFEAREEARRPEVEKIRAFAFKVRGLGADVPAVSCAVQIEAIILEAAAQIVALTEEEVLL